MKKDNDVCRLIWTRTQKIYTHSSTFFFERKANNTEEREGEETVENRAESREVQSREEEAGRSKHTPDGIFSLFQCEYKVCVCVCCCCYFHCYCLDVDRECSLLSVFTLLLAFL